MGVAREQAFHVSEHNQHVGVHDVRHHRGEHVIVAERAPAELVHRDDVVLVDDGDDSIVHKPREGVANVQIAFPVVNVSVRKQGLGDLDVVPSEELLIDVHKPPLPDGGERLAHGYVAVSGGIGERAAPGGDRAG